MLIPYFNKPSLPQTYKTNCTKLSNSDEKFAFLKISTFLNNFPFIKAYSIENN